MSELTAKAKQQNIKTNDTGFRIETFRNEEIFNAAGPCVYAQGEEKNNGFAISHQLLAISWSETTKRR